MWRCINQEQLLGWETGESLDYNPATQQNHQTPSSLKDTNIGLPHTPILFLQETDTTMR